MTVDDPPSLPPALTFDAATTGIARFVGPRDTPLTAVACGLRVARASEVLPAVSARRSDPARSSFIMRLDAVPRPFDVASYLGALVAVAHADGHLDELERVFIERQAALLHTPLPEPGTTTLDDLLGQPGALDPRTRKAIVRDLVFLARVDGHYDATERALVRRIAAALGHDDAWVERLEHSAVVPAVLDDAPSWFQEYWFLGTKAE